MLYVIVVDVNFDLSNHVGDFGIVGLGKKRKGLTILGPAFDQAPDADIPYVSVKVQADGNRIVDVSLGVRLSAGS